MKALKLSLYDINVILIFAGFPFITSFSDYIPSILYRALALGVSLICLWQSRFRIGTNNSLINGYLWILFLMILKVTWGMTLGEFSMYPNDNVRTLIFSFSYGVVLFPLFAFISSYDRINWHSCFLIIQIMLLLCIGLGLFSYTGELTTDGRANMNARQSTLAFGDNSVYLFLLSSCLYWYRNEINLNNEVIIKIICFLGIILGIYGVMKAGSRGPLLSGIAGISFFFFKLKRKVKIRIVLLCMLLIILIGGFIISWIKDIAPILYDRTMASIETGDLSGRDVLFISALNIFFDNLLFGATPLVLTYDSYSSFHNCYLDVAVGLGVFGFIYFIRLNYIIISAFLKCKYKNLTFYVIGSLFFCNAARALSGIHMIDNAFYSLIFCSSCFILYNQLK